MDEDDPEFAKAMAAADFFRRRYEEEVLARAEMILSDMPPSMDLPMPNTSHPVYAGYKIDFDKVGSGFRIRLMDRTKPSDLTEPKDITSTDFKIHTLMRKRCIGQAPFVGDPIWTQGVYVWEFWMDELGRHIAGDAKLELHQRPVPLHRIF